jgi:hemolysin activation/secretion protein
MHANQKSGLAAALLMSFWGTAAWAQTTPDAGAIQRQIEQELKAAPVQRTQPTAKAPRTLSPAREGAGTLAVNSFVFEGNTRLSADQLAAIVAPYQGRQYELEQLRQIADIVADAYREAGWLVRVSLPKQEVKDGVVKLHIVEAAFGKTIVQGSQTRVDPAMLKAMVEAAQTTGQPVQTQSIDRALLLLDGLPGLNVAGNLVEGQEPGQTDLLLGVADRAGVTGDISLANTGARSTGANHALANLNINSPLYLGDQLQIMALKSQGSDFERLAWTVPVGYDGLRVGVHGTRLAYKLVGDFANLNGYGTALGQGLDLSYPWLRSQASNVNLSVSYDNKRFDNNANGVSASHYGINVLNLGVNASESDDWQGGGFNNLSLLSLIHI